jgi:hypothetical protein
MDDYPWLVYEAIDFLEEILQPDWRVFEWGSGGSTLFYANRVAHVISIEHEQEPMLDLHKEILDREITNCILAFMPPEPGELGQDNSNPAHFYSKAYAGKNFKRYATAIELFRGSFDLVLVNGRARPSCLEFGHKKVAPGGHLVLDNSDRMYYTIPDGMRDWERFAFSGPGPYISYPWETTIWQRP